MRILLALMLCWSVVALADEQIVIIEDAYIDIRTGPGRGYPVYHVIERDEDIVVISRRTDWVKVETTGRQRQAGWVHVDDLVGSLADTDNAMSLREQNQSGGKRWQWSVSGGDFAGASAISSAIAFSMTSNINLRLEGTQILGTVSDGWMVAANVQHTPFPHWRVSPYFSLGTGLFSAQPFSTIVQAEDRKDQTLSVGAGMNMYLARRFMLHLDYRRHTVLTSRENNEEIDEWKLGISVFF